MHTILLVEDDEWQSARLVAHLKGKGHKVITAADGLTAVDMLMSGNELSKTITAIVSDCRMPRGRSGIWLLQYLNRMRSEIPFLLHSSEPTYREMDHLFDLKEVPEIFSRTQFHLKSDDLGYIDSFLQGIE